MMSDYKVEMINDGMQEFYVDFHGPSESKSSIPIHVFFFFFSFLVLVHGFLSFSSGCYKWVFAIFASSFLI
jgi:hypothetical protein